MREIKAVDTRIAEEDDIIGEGGKLQCKGEALCGGFGDVLDDCASAPLLSGEGKTKVGLKVEGGSGGRKWRLVKMG